MENTDSMSKDITNKLKKKIADAVDISKDVILDTVLIRATGNSELIIENYKGITEYTESNIRLKANPENIKICGTNMELSNISDEMLCICGTINKILFTHSRDGDCE